MDNQRLIGIAISKGIAIGKAKLLSLYNSSILPRNEFVNNSETEKAKFEQARIQIINESNRIIEKYKNKVKIKSIIESELMFLKDDQLSTNINLLIEDGNNCENAIAIFFDNYISIINNNNNNLSNNKINDIHFLKQKLLQNISEEKNDFSEVKNRIVIASLLDSDEILKIYENNAIGLATEYGSNLSHSSIISRSLNIPAVFGLKSLLNKIKDNDELIIDGYIGEVIVNPDAITKKYYENKLLLTNSEYKSFQNYKETRVKNKNGESLRFYTNINNLIDLENTLVNNADGIGLVRTENLVHNIEEIFEEDIQHSTYEKIAESIYPRSVTFRLFDFGYDKLNLNDEKEDNPALGLRGIRYLLSNKHILETQLYALIRTSVNGNVRLLIPMVTGIEEVIEIKKLVHEISMNLNLHPPKVGAMVETPAAAMMISKLIKESDFISIGTNDLMQYYFAADRNNELVKNYLNYKDESFITLLNEIRKTCEENEKELVICGQIASEEESLQLLVDEGFKSFSVIPSRILYLKKTLIK